MFYFGAAANAMRGTLPEEGMSAGRILRIFEVFYNHFTGSIPPAFFLQSHMTRFEIAINHFTGTLSVEAAPFLQCGQGLGCS
eukprot:3652417-Amphidinium_carterae.1